MPGQGKTWTLYVLRCRDGSLYTGVTTDPERRLRQHNTGKGAKYTRSRTPCVGVAQWAVGDRSRALRLEYRFKALSKSVKESLLDRDLAYVLRVLEPEI